MKIKNNFGFSHHLVLVALAFGLVAGLGVFISGKSKSSSLLIKDGASASESSRDPSKIVVLRPEAGVTASPSTSTTPGSEPNAVTAGPGATVSTTPTPSVNKGDSITFAPRVPSANTKKVPANSELRMQLAEISSTVFGNIAVTQPSKQGFITAYPCDSKPNPLTADLNYQAGQTVSSGIIVATNVTGWACFYSSEETHLIFDQTFVLGATTLQAGGKARSLDTRANTRLKKNEIRELDMSSVAVGTSLVYGSMTVINPAEQGYVSIVPCGDFDRTKGPETTTLSFGASKISTNAFVANVSKTGQICVFSSTDTDLVVDAGKMNNYTGVGMIGAGRIYDDRSSSSKLFGKSLDAIVKVGQAGYTQLLNVTVLSAAGVTGDEFLSVYSCEYPQRAVPQGTKMNDIARMITTSQLNSSKGEMTSSFAVTGVNGNGETCLSSTYKTDVVIDKVGELKIDYNTKPRPVRVFDSRLQAGRG
jgi:hypothetical protein